MKLQLLIVAAFATCLVSARIDEGKRCDAGFFYRGSRGSQEINRDCWSQCYYKKYKCGDIQCSAYLADDCTGARTRCADKCNEECDRCSPDGYDQHRITPSCPKPKCLVQRVGAQKCNLNCGGLSQKVQDALTAKYARKKLSTGVVGFDDICQIYCACKFYGPSSFPWFGTSLCGNLSPLPQRRLRSLPLFDEADQNVGGGKIYGEYNKGPVKVGGEWEFDEAEQNVGGGKIYGEYNKGPVKVGGEWEFDEEDQSVGYDDFGQPSHTRPHMPDGNSIGNWINFRL